MDKNKIKKNNSYNATAIEILAEKYGFKKIYIRQCLRGDSKSIAADNIRADYKTIVQNAEPLKKAYIKEVETLINKQ